MQQAIPYKSWSLPLSNNHATGVTPKLTTESAVGALKDAVSENAVIVLAPRGCCMSHVVKRLLNGHGVNPMMFEFDEINESEILKQIESIMTEIDGTDKRRVQFPAVFIGGRMLGGLDQVMESHITGDLIPLLKQAGALWL
ncbi:monothiol glutaredoxin-S5-like [Rutidosis leptorrhynchoides]|uniref:monothiol glutaredoxin-S5-like n=1 Tax=Rutidosis leptorrhynchoides TaxID=125765 RepID=UPI003A9961B6